jgi:hypothetical protein
MGPEYFGLKSEPRVKEIETGIYGDWFCTTESGIYLQQWNSTKIADANLVFIDFESMTVQTIASNIDSVFWEAEKSDGKLIIHNTISGQAITVI